MTTQSVVTYWFIAGLLLMIAEFFATYFIFVFLGVAAIITGALVLIGLSAEPAVSLAVFSAISVLLLVTARRVVRQRFKSLTAEVINQEAGFDDIVGKEAKVISGFKNGDTQGRVFFRGTEWDAVSSTPLVHGDRVIISAQENHKLKVQKN